LRHSTASVAVACVLGAACGGGDLVLPDDAPPAAVEASRGNDQSAAPGAELPAPIVVKVTDADGGPVAGVRVAFELASGAAGGETLPDTAITNAEGEASARWVLGEDAGEQEVTAEVVGAGLPVVSFTATAVEGRPQPDAERSSITAAPATIEVVTGLSVITVAVRDGRGDPLSGVTVTLAATGLGNILTQPSSPTGADGTAQGTLQGVVPGTRVISASVDGVDVIQTASVTVVATPEPPPSEAQRLEFRVQPSDAAEDEIIAPAVEVVLVDEGGDLVELSGVEIRLELLRDDKGSNELEGNTTRLTVDGVAVFPDLRVDRDENGYRLRATAPGLPELGSTDSETFDIED
jgi:hypothetical protein